MIYVYVYMYILICNMIYVYMCVSAVGDIVTDRSHDIQQRSVTLSLTAYKYIYIYNIYT